MLEQLQIDLIDKIFKDENSVLAAIVIEKEKEKITIVIYTDTESCLKFDKMWDDAYDDPT